MRYQLASGRLFTLVSYSLVEWGTTLAARLIEHGCSTEYALAVRDEYANAVPYVPEAS